MAQSPTFLSDEKLLIILEYFRSIAASKLIYVNLWHQIVVPSQSPFLVITANSKAMKLWQQLWIQRLMVSSFLVSGF